MASRFWVGGTGTWDGSTTTNWAASTGGAGGQSVPGSGDDVHFDSNSGAGTVTVNFGGTVTIGSLSLGAFSGTLDFSANNNSVTFAGIGTGGISSSGSTATLNMGNGTWTFNSGNATIWDTHQLSALNANSSTIVVGNTGFGVPDMLFGSSQTINNLTIGPFSPSYDWRCSVRVASFGTITVSGTLLLSVPCHLDMPAGNITVSGTFTATGTSSTNFIVIDTAGGATLSIPNNTTLNWCVLKNWACSNTGIVANNSFAQKVTGITVNAPGGGGGSGIIGS